jgi:hypothetical protein
MAIPGINGLGCKVIFEGVKKDFFNRKVHKETTKSAKINSIISILCDLGEKTLWTLRSIFLQIFHADFVEDKITTRINIL